MNGSDLGVCSAPCTSQNEHTQATSGSRFLGAGQQCSLPQNSLDLLPDCDVNTYSCLCPLPDPPTTWSVALCQLVSI